MWMHRTEVMRRHLRFAQQCSRHKENGEGLGSSLAGFVRKKCTMKPSNLLSNSVLPINKHIPHVFLKGVCMCLPWLLGTWICSSKKDSSPAIGFMSLLHVEREMAGMATTLLCARCRESSRGQRVSRVTQSEWRHFKSTVGFE